MADQKLTNLPSLPDIEDNDLIYGVDSSADTSNKVEVSQVKEHTIKTGDFSTLSHKEASDVLGNDQLIIRKNAGGDNEYIEIQDLQNKFFYPGGLPNETTISDNQLVPIQYDSSLWHVTMSAIKNYIHTGHSSGFTPSLIDGEVDGVGENPNTYITLKDAVDDGKLNILISTAVTETDDILLINDTLIYFNNNSSINFGPYQIDKNNTNSISFIGKNHYSSIIRYNPSAANKQLIKNSSSNNAFYITNLSIYNESSFDNTHLIELNNSVVIAFNIFISPGNSDNSGIVFDSSSSRSTFVTLTGQNNSTNSIKLIGGIHSNYNILNGVNNQSDEVITVEYPAQLSDVRVTDQVFVKIKSSSYISNAYGVDNRSNPNSFTLEIFGDNPTVDNVSVNSLIVDPLVTGGRIFNSKSVTPLSGTGKIIARSGNDENIGNDYHSGGGGGGAHDFYDVIIGHLEKYKNVETAYAAGFRTILMIGDCSDNSLFSISEDLYIRIRSGVTWTGGANFNINFSNPTSKLVFTTLLDENAIWDLSSCTTNVFTNINNNFFWNNSGGLIKTNHIGFDFTNSSVVNSHALIKDCSFSYPNLEGSGITFSTNTVIDNLTLIGSGTSCADSALQVIGKPIINNLKIEGDFYTNPGQYPSTFLCNSGAVVSNVICNTNSACYLVLSGNCSNIAGNNNTHISIQQDNCYLSNVYCGSMISRFFQNSGKLSNCKIIGDLNIDSNTTELSIVGCEAGNFIYNDMDAVLIRSGNNSIIGNDSEIFTFKNITVADSPYTLKMYEYITANCVGGNIRINVPTAVGRSNQYFSVVKDDETAFEVSLHPVSGEKIAGQDPFRISVYMEQYKFISNNENYYKS